MIKKGCNKFIEIYKNKRNKAKHRRVTRRNLDSFTCHEVHALDSRAVQRRQTTVSNLKLLHIEFREEVGNLQVETTPNVRDEPTRKGTYTRISTDST